MDIKIDKVKIVSYSSKILLGASIIGLIKIEGICAKTKHREELCPITRLEMFLGHNEDAISHQKDKIYDELALEQDYENYPRLGTLERECICYTGIGNDFKEPVNYACFNALDDGGFAFVENDIIRERVGTGLLTGDDYVQLREAKDKDALIVGEYNDNYVYASSKMYRLLNSINYIGPLGKNYPNSVVLEDRDGNKKEVVSLNSALTEEQVAKLFKTYYFDENDGFYKIDEDLFANFMRTSFVTREYTDKVVRQEMVEDNGVQKLTVDATCPDGYVEAANGMCYRDVNPYADFSFYSFRTVSRVETNDEAFKNVRKLVK